MAAWRALIAEMRYEGTVPLRSLRRSRTAALDGGIRLKR